MHWALPTVGQLTLTRAYAHAPAAQVGPFVYTGVIFAALADWLLWHTLPDLLFVPGALLIAAAGAFMLLHRPPAAPDAEVAEICVTNGQPVEFGEILFRLRPLS